MARRNFGQLTRTAIYYPAGASTEFLRTMATNPSQPYRFNMKPEEIEKEVYKELEKPIASENQQVASQTSPEKVVTLKTGLEVPAYILKRDIERKEADAAQHQIIEIRRPPLFASVGSYATQKPIQAAIIAVVLGAIFGRLYFAKSR